MEKRELQKHINKLIMIHDYAKEDRKLEEISDEEVHALQVAIQVLQEKCDSIK